MSSQIYNFFPRNGLIYGEIFKVYLFIVPKKTNITTLMLLQKKRLSNPQVR